MSSSEGSGLRSLLSDRLILVTGKGGTGKTTAAAAIALLLAANGRRTVLCEADAQSPALTPIFGVEPGFRPERVHERLDVCNLVWPESLAAWLGKMLPIGRMVRAVLQNELVRRFLDFVPGSQELVTVSSFVDLTERYDAVVVDLPASGHAFSLLDITRSALGLFRSGPVRNRVLELRKVLKAPGTRLVLVALPEEMVVNETLETAERMVRYDLTASEPVLLLNRARAPELSPEAVALLDLLVREPLSGEAAELVAAGRWEQSLEAATGEAEARLSEIRTPEVVPPVPSAGNPRAAVRMVARHFATTLRLREPSWT